MEKYLKVKAQKIIKEYRSMSVIIDIFTVLITLTWYNYLESLQCLGLCPQHHGGERVQKVGLCLLSECMIENCLLLQLLLPLLLPGFILLCSSYHCLNTRYGL